MSNELAQKQLTSILERFKALLKQREYELRVSGGGGDDVLAETPSMEDIVQLYEAVLSELTSNLKPIITDLTIIAGEQRKHGEGIANAICERIVEVPVEQKLPSLYLLDSIVKNIGREYVRYFSSRLAEVFCEAYRQVNPNLHSSMRHLFGTWSTVFPPFVLHKIEMQLPFSRSANQQSSGVNYLRSSESPRPTHGIHVKPKYLQQLEQHSGADSDTQLRRGTSAGLKLYGQKRSATACDEFYSDDTEVPSSHVRVERLSSTGNMPKKPQLSSVSRVSRPFSPSRIGSDRLLSSEVDPASDGSPRRLIERASPYHPVFDYGRGRAVTRDGETREWQRKHFYDDYHNRSESTLNAYKLSNGHELQTPKALINAYGNDRGQGISNTNPVQVERLDINGMVNKVIPRAWQNTEEEEFDWEDMRPTLADRRSNDFSLPSVPTFGSNRTRPAGLESNSRSSHTTQTRQAWNEFSGIGISSLGGEENVPRVDNLPDGGSVFVRPPTIVPRTGSSSFDSVTIGTRPTIIPSATGVLPPVNSNKSHQPPTMHSNYSLPQHNWSQFNSGNHINAVMTQGQNKHSYMAPSNPIPVAQRPLLIPNMPTGSLHLHGGAFPPFPPGPPPASQMIPATQNAGPLLPNQPQSGAFSGLISTLMAQGLISLSKPSPTQDSVGLEFDADLLKLRHESALSALYVDLPRQCTTCGLRFKFQEEHSAHMDWHVTRNRMSKNRKQKSSRKWFVSASMWLSGAEALGTDAVPGFLPTKDIVEKKDDEELAVPADEDQSICAICGDSFDDFYSDETEEWMYRGAVYMNAPNGPFEGMDRSQLGPIVHAKCRTESYVVPPEDFVQYDGGNYEDISQRKRLRRS